MGGSNSALLPRQARQARQAPEASNAPVPCGDSTTKPSHWRSPTLSTETLARFRDVLQQANMMAERRWFLDLIPMSMTVRFIDAKSTPTSEAQDADACVLKSYPNIRSVTVAKLLQHVDANPIHTATFTSQQRSEIQRVMRIAKETIVRRESQPDANAGAHNTASPDQAAIEGTPSTPSTPSAPSAPSAALADVACSVAPAASSAPAPRVSGNERHLGVM